MQGFGKCFDRAEKVAGCKKVRVKIFESKPQTFADLTWKAPRQVTYTLRDSLTLEDALIFSHTEYSMEWARSWRCGLTQRLGDALCARLHSTLLTRPRDSEQPHQSQDNSAIWSACLPISKLSAIRGLIKLQASALTTYTPLGYHCLRAYKTTIN